MLPEHPTGDMTPVPDSSYVREHTNKKDAGDKACGVQESGAQGRTNAEIGTDTHTLLNANETRLTFTCVRREVIDNVRNAIRGRNVYRIAHAEADDSMYLRRRQVLSSVVGKCSGLSGRGFLGGGGAGLA